MAVQWSAPAPLNGLSADQILSAPPGTIVGAVGFGCSSPLPVYLGASRAPIVFSPWIDPTVASIVGPANLGTGAGHHTGDANFDAVLNHFASNGKPLLIHLINLTPGATYSVQVFGGAGNSYVIGAVAVPAGATDAFIQAAGSISALVLRAVSFVPPIRVTLQPVDRALDIGETATFTALATGPTPLTPQWQAGPASGPYKDLADDGRISGVHGYQLTIRQLKPSDAALHYRLKLNEATSREAALSVLGNPGPIIQVSPGGDVNAAAARVHDAGGGAVLLGEGIYPGSVRLASNVTLKGVGAKTIIAGGTVTQAANGVANIVVEDLVIDGQISVSSFSNGGSGPAGIFFGNYDGNTYNLTFKNVEVRNTGIAMQLVTVNGVFMRNCNFHDNGIGFSHNIYFTGDYNINMEDCISSWSRAGTGVHLDFSGPVAHYSFKQCEFSGNSGFGILSQDLGGSGAPGFLMEGCRVQFNGQSGGAGTGLDIAANGPVRTSRIEYNHGIGINVSDNVPLLNFFTFGNQGDPFYSHSPVGGWMNGLTPNVYPAELADGVTGPGNTADWVTENGGNALGAVDFNAKHGHDGALTWPNVSAPAAGPYALKFHYSNGSNDTLGMPLTVNGAFAGTVLFAPTGGWSKYADAQMRAILTGANNTVRLSVLSPGLGSPELSDLTVDAPVPDAPPVAPATLTFLPLRNAPRDSMNAWIQLNWKPAAGATYYNIFRNGIAIAIGVPGATFVDRHVPFSGAQFTYTVAAVNAKGQGPPATVRATSLIGYPVTLVAARAFGAIKLTGATSKGAKSYLIYRAQSKGGPFSRIAVTKSPDYADTKAPAGARSYYLMTASDGLTESAPSPEASAAPFAGGPLLFNGDAGAGAIQSGKAMLGAAGDVWNGLAGAGGALVDSTGQEFGGVAYTLAGQGLNDSPAGAMPMDAATSNLMRDSEYARDAGEVKLAITGLGQFRNARFTLVVYAALADANQGSTLKLTGAAGGNSGVALTTSGASRRLSDGAGVAYQVFTGTIAADSLIVTSSANQSPFHGINGFQLLLHTPATN